MSESMEKGLKIFSEVFGQEMADGCRHMIDTGDDFAALQTKWTMEWAFGSVWSREGLPRKMRSLVVLGMLVGLRQPNEIKYHTKMALANGLTRAEIEEVVFTAIAYCGFPIANTAKTAMQEAFDEIEGRLGN